MVLTKIVPKYTGIAITSVGAVAITPVSFSDSVILMGLQVKMSLDIMVAYGIDASIVSLAADLVGSNLISSIGKNLASKLLQLIPFIGKPIEVIVDISVAGSITALLGAAISEVCAQFLKTCIRKDGSATISFIDYFTEDVLKEAISNIKNGKSDIDLKSIINLAINNFSKKKPE